MSISKGVKGLLFLLDPLSHSSPEISVVVPNMNLVQPQPPYEVIPLRLPLLHQPAEIRKTLGIGNVTSNTNEGEEEWEEVMARNVSEGGHHAREVSISTERRCIIRITHHESCLIEKSHNFIDESVVVGCNRSRKRVGTTLSSLLVLASESESSSQSPGDDNKPIFESRSS